MLIPVLILSAFAVAQSPVPIRTVSAPTAKTSEPLRVSEAREIAGGRLLVNSGPDRQLFVLDANLLHPAILADTNGAGGIVYPRFAKLIPFTGDSVLFVESDSRSMVLVTPDGKFGRVLAPPKMQDFNRLTSGGTTGTDAQGRLVYPGQRPMALSRPCQAVAPPVDAARPPPPMDSLTVLRADFETRTVDTLAKAKTIVIGNAFPTTVWDANCKAISARMKLNPEIPATDSWVVTSTGTIAIVRGHDYHVDWIERDGTIRSSPKMPFDWRRLTDAEKQNRIDSARHVVDSLIAMGGYRMQACGGGRSISFNTNPPPPGDGTPGGAGRGNIIEQYGSGGGGGRAGAGVASVGLDGPPGGNACQTLTVGVDYATPGEMADYISPIREGSARADRDGNIWILPTTSASAKGGLLYDVVNSKGELFERVQLPAGRDIEAFGPGGVLYLANVVDNGAIIERVKVLPGK